MLTCRVCLASDNVRLYDVNVMFNLKTAYETMTGSQISIEDGLPQKICSYCSKMLLKCISFRDKCCYTLELMKYFIKNQKEITKDDLISIQSHEQSLGLSQTGILPVIDIEYTEPVPIKEEFDLDLESIVKIENGIQEKIHKKTTLGKVKKRKKKLSKKKKLKDAESNIELELAGMEMDDGDDKNIGTCEVDNFDFPDMEFESDVDQDSQIEMDESIDDLKEAKLVLLSREEQLEEMEARKSSANYTKSKYKCHRCYRGFISEVTYSNHLERHNPKSGDHECSVCGVRWAEPRLLRAHMGAAHERKFLCTLCDHVSRSSYRAKEHYKWHTGYKFDCKICGATFGKSTSALTHMRLAHPSRHSCEVCGESFIGDLGLRMHKRRAHRFLTDSTYQCVHCQVRFQGEEALAKHLETAANGLCDASLIPCHQCGEGYASDELLKTHLKEHQSFTCDECSRTFNSARSYGVHVERVHLGVRARPRRATRRAPDTAVCEVCGKKCITMATLRYHQRTHTGEKPYQCPDCPKRFSVYQRLQIHLRTHTGECPYKCALCPKAFKHKAALNRHDRVHTGAKPYSCVHCGKSFSQSNSRKLHVNTVHLKMPAPYRNRKTT